MRGDGVFETLLVRDGGRCLLEAHLARLTQSARLIGPARTRPAALACGGGAAAQRWIADGGDEGVLRLVYSRGRESGSIADGVRHGRRGARPGRRRPAATGWRR